MNKLLKLVYTNRFFAILTLALQVGFIAVFVTGVLKNAEFYLIASYLISAIFIIIEINRHEESAFKITWIMLCAVVPIFGWFLYLYTHTGVISGNIQKAHRKAKETLISAMPDDKPIIREMDEKGIDTKLVKYLSKAGDATVFKNTSVEYYGLGDDMFISLLRELEMAEEFIFMEFFIINQKSYMWERVEDILIRKARAGVEVRLMYDGMGCMDIFSRNRCKILERQGIQCQEFAPIQPLLSTYQNNRDHRKIVVIDGRCAFSGGVNLADEYINRIVRFGHWKDTGFMLKGEGVAGYTGLFLSMWHTTEAAPEPDAEKYIKASESYGIKNAEGYCIPFGDSPLDNEYTGRNAYVDMINGATESVDIMTPYFVIDDAIFNAMQYATARGVKVRLILPGVPDKKVPYCLARSYYKELNTIGVEVYEYIPGFVHAKNTISDGNRAVVGSINYDYRSLYLHYECAMYMVDVPEIADIKFDFVETLSECKRMTAREYDILPWYYRLQGRILRFFATVI